MRRLNRRIFLFDLMDFAMNAGSEGVTDLADVILCLKLQLSFALGLFQRILKMKAGFALAGFFIEDALFLENLVRGQLFTGGIQTVSYTQLDVYKRQACRRPPRSCRIWQAD